jgi:DDE superfamily endonuclease
MSEFRCFKLLNLDTNQTAPNILQCSLSLTTIIPLICKKASCWTAINQFIMQVYEEWDAWDEEDEAAETLSTLVYQKGREDEKKPQQKRVLVAATVVAILLIPCNIKDAREKGMARVRITWENYVTAHSRDKKFHHHLRMKYPSFMKLSCLLQPLLAVDKRMAAIRGGAIIPEVCLYCTLRYLGDGKHSDIWDTVKISSTALYAVLSRTLVAICCLHQLSLKFPKTRREFALLAAGFKAVSTGNAIETCVGCIDGFLLQIITPRKKEVNNVRSYYSGHYRTSGINVQAVCDADCRFLYFALCGPGSCSDSRAITVRKEGCQSLSEVIESIPSIYCIIGDAAYPTSEKLVSLYSGADRLVPMNDDFNYYASQCRIRIEMAFGIFTQKFAIFQRELKNQMRMVKLLALGASRLHNYCIDERKGWSPVTEARHAYPVTDPVEETDVNAGCAIPQRRIGIGKSANRHGMTLEIHRKGLHRPVNQDYKK